MGRRVGKCMECGQVTEIKAKGRCAKCDQAYRRGQDENEMTALLGANAGRGHRRYVKEEDHLLETVAKVIKLVNTEPGLSEDDSIAIKKILQPYLAHRAQTLVPHKFKPSPESTVDTKSESTVDLDGGSENRRGKLHRTV
jgi:hypothetical protein